MTRPSFVPVNGVRAQPLDVELAPAQRCPYCRATVEPEHELVACKDCRTVMHADCALQGCTTLGCAPVTRLRFTPKSPRRRWPRVRWSRVAVAALLVSGVGLLAWSQEAWRPAPPPAPAPEPLYARPHPLDADVLDAFKEDKPMDAGVWFPPVESVHPCCSQPLHVTFEPLGFPIRVDPGPYPMWGLRDRYYSPEEEVEILRRSLASRPVVREEHHSVWISGHVDRAGEVTLEGPDGEAMSWELDQPGPLSGSISIPPGHQQGTIRVRFVARDGQVFEKAANFVAGGFGIVPVD